MKILITNNHLQQLGGTETWVLTMVREISRSHEVFVFTHHRGYVSNLLGELVTDTPPRCDLALVNHNPCIPYACADVKIFTSHGILQGMERCVDGCHAYVAVSEEIATIDNLKRIIRNPIDTSLFDCRTPVGQYPRRALAIVSEKALYTIGLACDELGIELVRPTRLNYNIAELINSVDLVFSIGRGALEAMSCGRPVILYDERNYSEGSDGYFNDELVRQCNYSGRYFQRHFDKQNLMAELQKYDSADGLANRDYVVQHHDVRKVCQQYLAIFDELRSLRGYKRRTPERGDRESKDKYKNSVTICVLAVEDSVGVSVSVRSALNQTYAHTKVAVIECQHGLQTDGQCVPERFANVKYLVANSADSIAAVDSALNSSDSDVIIFLEPGDTLSPTAAEVAHQELCDQDAILVHWPLWKAVSSANEDETMKMSLPTGCLKQSVLENGPIECHGFPLTAAGWSCRFLKSIWPLPDDVTNLSATLLQVACLKGRIKKVFEPQGRRRVPDAASRSAVASLDAIAFKASQLLKEHSCVLGYYCDFFELPANRSCWKTHSWWQQLSLLRDDLLRIVKNRRVILADFGQFDGEFFEECEVVPFVERDGIYWGAPVDDGAAISELERLRYDGADFFAIAWPAFWLLDEFPRFGKYLRDRFFLVLRTEHLIIFNVGSQ